jgi:putative ABC transport system ATP-binding protein
VNAPRTNAPNGNARDVDLRDPGLGIAGVLDDDDGPRPAADGTVTGGALVRWVLGRQRGRIAVGALSGIAWMGFIALLPVALGIAVNRIVDDNSAGSVALACVLLGAVTLAQAAAGVLRHRCALLLYNRTRWLVERLVTRRVLDPRGGGSTEAGALLSLASNDTQRVGGIADIMCRGSGAVVTFAAVGVGMLAASPVLGALVLVGLPPCLLVLVPLWRPYERRAADQQQRLAEASAIAADVTTGLRVVKGLGSEDGVRRWFADGTAQVRESAVALARLDSAWTALTDAVPAVFLALTIWVGGRLALDGDLSPGALVTFTGLAVFLAIPLATFAEAGDAWATGLASARRIATVLSSATAVADDGHTSSTSQAPFALRLDRVRHGPLVDFDLDVRAGEVLGVAADDPTVAGALGDLVTRRADPAGGRVLLGADDVRDLPLDVLRGCLVAVDGHHPWVLDGTIRDNVALGAPGERDDALEDALLAAAGEDLLARRDGLHAAVGERGLALSGGQRQRLTVARGYAAHPPILVLDEPTSALDVATEIRLLDRLRAIRAGRTTVLLTVSAPVLAACDRVVVVENGRVARAGTHAELLRDARYRALVAPEAS